MKKMFLYVVAICCSTLFAQEPAAAPVAPAVDSAKVAEPAAAPAAAPVAEAVKAEEPAKPSDAAPVAETAPVAPAVDSAKVAEPVAAPAPAPVAEAAKAEEPAKPSEAAAAPVAETAPVASAVDTAKVAEATEVAAESDTSSNWTKFVGVSLSIPVESYKVGGKKINFIDYGFTATYMGLCNCGFTPKATISAGLATTKKIPFYPSDGWQVGMYSSVEIGAGYSFVNREKFLLSTFFVLGFEYADFVTESKKFNHKELGRVDRDYLESFAALTLGGDVMARFALTDRVGLFASVGGRWVAVTVSDSAVRYKKGDNTRIDNVNDDGVGYFSIVPSFGVMWKI